MRFLYLVFILFLNIFTTATAQTPCLGSLGDPVIREDFGSGTNPGVSLPTSVTNYSYTTVQCPPDGSYTLVNRIGNCFDSWHNLTDASGMPNGYIMLVNASYDPGIFYTQRIDASRFCANTTYEFSAMIANVMRTSHCGDGGIRPNLTLYIETASGTVLNSISTGDIPPNGQWAKYPLCFTTSSNITDIIVKIVNNAPGGCGNDLALDDITFRARGPEINVNHNGTGSVLNERICLGQNLNFTITANAETGYQNYQWQQFNGSTWEDIPGETGNTYNTPATGNLPAGVYRYRVAVVKDGNIGSLTCRTFSEPSTITILPKPEVVSPPDQIVCTGTNVEFTGGGGSTYVWSGPNLPPTTLNTNTLIINNVNSENDGIYEVFAFTSDGCAAEPKQFRLTVSPPIIATITPGPVEICQGQSIVLEATGGTSYQWSPAAGLSQTNIANPVATPAQTTTYTVFISNGSCTTQRQVTVTVFQSPRATVPAKKVIFEGESTTLNTNPSGDITEVSWWPTTGLNDPHSLNPVANPTHDITYTLTLRSALCGEFTTNVFVRVYKQVTVPNAFTPNGDGFNDVWNIKNLDTYPESNIEVFTRGGQVVFRSNGYAQPWDGTHKGQQLPVGTYYYVINLKNGTPLLKGWLTLLK